jgi:sporulation protein YlmC with PRC-barrel domain
MRAKVIAAVAVIGAALVCAAVLYSEDQSTGNMNQQTLQTPMVRVKDLLGAKVINTQSDNLGKIEDVVFNPDTGQIRYAVLEYGGTMGIGAKYLAAPWLTVKLVLKGTKTASGTTIDRDYFVLDLSKDALRNAPSFDNDHWPNFADQEWTNTINRFYNAQKTQPGTMTR